MKNKLFKISLVLMSNIILGATVIPSSIALANSIDSTENNYNLNTTNILVENDKLIINGKEITESEFKLLLENSSDIKFEEQSLNSRSFAMAPGLVFFVPSVGTVAIAAGGVIILAGAVVTTAWIINAVKNHVNNEDNWTADQIISKKRKGSIRREFPGEYLNKKYKDIKNEANKGNAKAKKAHKLLNDGRFKK